MLKQAAGGMRNVNDNDNPGVTRSTWNLAPAHSQYTGATETEIVRYMQLVAPMSAETWVTVHHRKFIPTQKEPIFPGNAHQTIDTAVADASYWLRKGCCVYLSQGMYRTAGPKANGDGSARRYPRADRTYPNLVACKNLYIDVDVKEDGYASTQEAAQAIRAFVNWMEFEPTAIVGSGSGGFHVYWVLDTAIDRAAHANMASRLINAGIAFGLKFDRQCTKDATRILRVAGTQNFKHADPTNGVPATPVTLMYSGKPVEVDTAKANLERWPATVTLESKSGASVHAPGAVDEHGLPLDENSDLTGGMKRDYAPANIDEVKQHCPFVKNTLDAGGANLVGDAQWHTVVALACHCVEPRETAHRLCNKSQHYTEEGTDAKLETAQQAREQRPEIGPPKCATITNEREECKTCPHLALNTTPLSVGLKVNPAGKAADGGAGGGGASAPNTPAGKGVSEDELALRFADAYADDMRYVALWGKWLIFDGHVWVKDDMMRVFTRARKICRSAAARVPKQAKELLSAATVAAVERLARSDERLVATTEQWDLDIYLLNTPGGVVDLKTGTIRPSTAEDYMTKITGVAPAVDDTGQLVVDCPLFLKFLGEIFPKDPVETPNFLQRASGYSITGSIEEHVLLFGYGTGRNGKGTYLSIQAHVLGDYHKSAEVETFLATRNERHSTELARLAGARLVTASEPEDHQRWATARVKKLTGGDPITARFMRADDFEYDPQFQLFIIGNHKPAFGAIDPALRDRLLMLEFNAYFAGSKRDNKLLDKLKNEAGGILSWMIQGTLEWIEYGLAVPPTVRATTDAYLASEDLVSQWIEDYCITGPNLTGASSALYESWKNFSEASGTRAGDAKWFKNTLEARGHNWKRASSGIIFEGIDLTAAEAQRVEDERKAREELVKRTIRPSVVVPPASNPTGNQPPVACRPQTTSGSATPLRRPRTMT
jgi:P4 family phage/plasmid primase-like protien